MYIDDLIEQLIDMKKICGNLKVYVQHYEEKDTPQFYHKKLIREEVKTVVLTSDIHDRYLQVIVLKE